MKPIFPQARGWATLLSLLGSVSFLSAQVPDAPSAPGAAAPAAPAGSPSPGSSAAPGASQPSPLGKDLPSFDPGSEILTWNGKSWNINNNRIFSARFEKYLNAPEATTAEDQQYQRILGQILALLAPRSINRENVDAAFKLLADATRYDIDARLCDSIAGAVYTVWAAQRQQQRLAGANEVLERERRQHEWNAKISSETGKIESSKTQTGKDAQGNAVSSTMTKTLELTPYLSRLAEVMARIKLNDTKRELSEVAAKIEYQALVAQLFLQRRFQHVRVCTSFYRALFNDGDSKLNLGKDTQELFSRSAGMAPTISTLDFMANEAMRDVREGVSAFKLLMEKSELESATKRLSEAFVVGEYLPEMRTLPREAKRQSLEFMRKSNQLISAIEVKDYSRAETLVHDLESLAKDFDSSKPMAAIETAKTVARMRLAKARNAAMSGDRQVLETELAAATELWPRNPELAEISQKIFAQGDVQQRALNDFDQLYAQKNFRQIAENNARYIAAVALSPDRKTQLEKVLKDMQTIEAAILRAQEMQRQSNFAGAWESVESAATNFPDDTRLNQIRADLTTQAADFVRTLRQAQELEKRGQIGSSLSLFLRAQKIYPASDAAKEGIGRIKDVVFGGAQ